MESNYEDRNKAQIIRIDARGCFVEAKNDAFDIGKVHLEFATYDSNKPSGQRQTNHVHIYLDMPEFLCLTQEAMSGMLHARARQQKAAKDTTPLYQCLGGTSAEKLKQYGRSRPDGKSLSRTVKLLFSDKKDDFYLFVADSGPGDADAKGLIVPRFGNSPENHVAVSMSWRSVNELLIMAKTHYEAWLAAKYVVDNSTAAKQNTQKQQNTQNVKQQTGTPQAQVQSPARTPPTQAGQPPAQSNSLGGTAGNTYAASPVPAETEIKMF